MNRENSPVNPRPLKVSAYGGNGDVDVGEFLGTIQLPEYGYPFDIYLSKDRAYMCWTYCEFEKQRTNVMEISRMKRSLIPSFHELAKSMVDLALADPSISPNAHQ